MRMVSWMLRNMRAQPAALSPQVFILLYWCSLANTSYGEQHKYRLGNGKHPTQLQTFVISQSWSVLTDLSGDFPQVQDLQSISRLGFKRHQLLSSLHGHNTNLRRIYSIYTTEAGESTCWVFIRFKNIIIVTDPLKHSRFEAGQVEPSRHSGQQRRTSRARLRPDDQRQ